MGKFKIRALAVCLAGVIVLEGCGTAPYELSETEEGIIVNYAAHIVSKFNSYQGDGLTYVNVEEETEVEPELEETDTEEVIIEDEEEISLPEEQVDGSVELPEEEETGISSTLQDVFGSSGLEVAFTGYELSGSYVDNDVYALNPAAGKSYLVLHIAVSNMAEEDMTLDNLSNGPIFRITLTDQDGASISANAYTTILLNDFSTYSDVVPAGTTVETVLLFEVADTITSADSLILQVKENGSTFEINL